MGFSRQEYWSGLPLPSPEDLPYPGIEPGSSPIVGRCFYHLSHQGSPKGWVLKALPYQSIKICCCLVTELCPALLTPQTVACPTPLSMGFPRQECWIGLPFLSLGDLSNDMDQTCISCFGRGFFTTEPPGKPIKRYRKF